MTVLLIVNEKLLFIVLGLLFPILILDIFSFQIIKEILLKLFNKHYNQFEIYTTGVKIKKKYFDWKNIRSISPDTGRPIKDNKYFIGIKLPVLQKIYLIDKEYNEFKCVVDYDYFSKPNRQKNNLEKIKELLMGLDKLDIIHDWAQLK